MTQPPAFRSLVLALSLALLAPLPVLAQDAPAAAPAATPAWVERSNANTMVLLRAQAPFAPEQMSFFGIPGYDHLVADFGPDSPRRFREATRAARTELAARLAAETDPDVRQDLAILLQAADDQVEASDAYERLTRPWADVGQSVFNGLQGLLSDQVPAGRRAAAVERLRRYAGLEPGTTPLATLARDRYEERDAAGLLAPTAIEVQQALDNWPTYLAGLRELFDKYGMAAGAGPALDALEAQVAAYNDWSRAAVLPAARTDYALPPELYALALKDVGIDIAPRDLVGRAQLGFMETRAAMQALAPLVAEAHGIASTDYRDVIRDLKDPQFAREEIEPHYRNVVMPELDRLIAAHDIVSLPDRPMQMRLGTEAESAASPAPHFLPAPLVGNTGQQGTFVLPLGNPAAGPEAAYDDFNFPAVAWTLTAHEGRPGHELQFTAMVERGVSLARTLYAFNSVNVEGWALYAEAEMLPYEPIEGQLFALQFRLLRAARAMLDPLLNLGEIDRDTAMRVLLDEVVLSPAMARQEVDRYTVNAPGQAGSYFHGYSRIMQLRAETEMALGDRFDRQAFNDFLLDQGLLPPAMLARAVREQFIPARR